MSGDAGELRIRRMSTADLPRAMEIAGNLKDAPHWAESAWVTALDEGAAQRRIVLVAADPLSGTVEGFAVANLVPPQAELESIAVAGALQRKGVGRRLFARLAGDLRAEGIGEVLLEVRASNRATQGFYRALGFMESGRRTRYYVEPEEDAVLMRLRLP